MLAEVIVNLEVNCIANAIVMTVLGIILSVGPLSAFRVDTKIVNQPAAAFPSLFLILLSLTLQGWLTSLWLNDEMSGFQAWILFVSTAFALGIIFALCMKCIKLPSSKDEQKPTSNW